MGHIWVTHGSYIGHMGQPWGHMGHIYVNHGSYMGHAWVIWIHGVMGIKDPGDSGPVPIYRW